LKIYRVAKKKHIKGFSGEGARLFGGRWNKKGVSLLYFSEHLSLCVLEILVHTNQQLITNDYWYIEVEIPENEIKHINPKGLPQNWRVNPPLPFTQDYGTDWLLSHKSLVLKVPSAVLPNENNFLINPNHKQFSQVNITAKGVLDIDYRVF